METIEVSLKHVRKIKDKSRFNIDHLQDYSLSLLIGAHDLQVCAIDTRKNRVLLLEDYIFQGVESNTSHLQAIQNVYENNHLLNAAFWKEVKVIFKNRKFALVPTELFEPSEKEVYLQLNAEYSSEKERCLTYTSEKKNISITFAASNYLVSFFQERYPNGNLRMYHQSCALLEGLNKYPSPPREKVLYLFIDRFYLQLAVSDPTKGLAYLNTFPIRSGEDYVKYMLGVMQNQGMNPKTARAVLFGFIRPQSKHYQFLHKYVPNLSFGHRNKGIKQSYDFDEIGEHQYFELLNSPFLG